MAGASLASSPIVDAYRHGVAYAVAFEEACAHAAGTPARSRRAAADGRLRFSRFTTAMADRAQMGALQDLAPVKETPGARSELIRRGLLPRVLWLGGVAAAGVGVSVLIGPYFMARPISALPPASASSATAPARATAEGHVATVRSRPVEIGAGADILPVALAVAPEAAMAVPEAPVQAAVDRKVDQLESVESSPKPAVPLNFRIQLASLRNPDNVKYVWHDFETRSSAALAAHLQRYVVRRETPRGVVHLVQVGAFEQARPAEIICRDIRQRGGDCIVVREP